MIIFAFIYGYCKYFFLWPHLLVKGVNVVHKDAGDVAVDKHDVLEEDERALQGVGVVHLHHQQPLQRLLHNVPLVRAS
jgi:hypothetical protein